MTWPQVSSISGSGSDSEEENNSDAFSRAGLLIFKHAGAALVIPATSACLMKPWCLVVTDYGRAGVQLHSWKAQAVV